jgi:hypothetical protein
MNALMAGFWGFVGGASLLIGALVGLYVGVPQRVIAIIAATGAGVLVSSVAFELMGEAYLMGGTYAASIGILLGALAFFAADWAVCYIGGKHRKRSGGQQAGGSSTAITIGAILDGIPESVAIGVSLIEGGGLGDGCGGVLEQRPGEPLRGLRHEESGPFTCIHSRVVGNGCGDLRSEFAVRVPFPGRCPRRADRCHPGLRGRGDPHHARQHYVPRGL